MIIRNLTAMAVLSSLALRVDAGLIAEEQFIYPENINIVGQNGGVGWTGPWAGGSANTDSPGLAFPGLATAGNSLGYTPGGAPVRNFGPVAPTTGTSLTLSALLISDTNPPDLSAAVIGIDGGGFGNAFTMGNHTTGSDWTLTIGGLVYSSGIAVTEEITYLVGRIDFLDGNDLARLWVNPTPGQPLGSPAISETVFDYSSLSRVFWQSPNAFAGDPSKPHVDEIRIEVSRSVPEPSTYALLIAGVVGLIGFGRKRR